MGEAIQLGGTILLLVAVLVCWVLIELGWRAARRRRERRRELR